MFMVNHLVGFGAGGGLEPVTLDYRTSAVDAANATSYTFSSQDIGTAGSNRQVVILVATTGGPGGTAFASSVTVGGVTATNLHQVASSNSTEAEIYIASVPSGTTADVVVNYPRTAGNCGIGVIAVYNGASTANDTGGSTDTSAPSDTLNIPANGAAFGVTSINGNTRTSSWSNLTEHYDGSVESSNYHSGASATFATEQTGLTITDTLSGSGVNVAMAIASIGSG